MKAYDSYYLVRMENMLKDLHPDLPLRAYCLAKIIQSEAIDLGTIGDYIREIHHFRKTLDRMLERLAAFRAFPDDYHLIWHK